MIFQLLHPRHDRAGFDCGVESVNRYLRQSARQQADRGLALTHVLLDSEESTDIIGFHTLLMSTVPCEVVPLRHLGRGSVPVVLLAQLGVDLRYQGQGYGKHLLYHSLQQAMRAADYVGCAAVVLDAVDDAAKAFYERRGFQELRDDPMHLWLPMSAVRDMFRSSGQAEHSG